jgi:hypothetical protein
MAATFPTGYTRCADCAVTLSPAQRRGHVCHPHVLAAHWTVSLRQELEGDFLARLDEWARSPKVQAWLAFMRWSDARD